ncbi:MAG: hypothetical protein JXR83_02265 [Deltaproteobacteria bacterium]|nr:hypothetical protein [Deltaproteobacteria bacterium]
MGALLTACWVAMASAMGQISDAEQQARALLDRGQAQPAIALLKQAVAQQPDAVAPRWLLARAYLMDNNDFWALRTLSGLAELDPGDCQPALWTAWVLLKQGSLDEAREYLETAACAPATAAAARRSLLLAMVEQHAGDLEQARAHLTAARQVGRVFDEDKAVLDHLLARVEPGRTSPLTGRFDLNLGWAANARAGSPADPAATGLDESSPAGQLNGWLQLLMPDPQWVRPSLELEARSTGYSNERGQGLSYLLLGARPGLYVGSGAPSRLLAYRFDALLLAGGDRYDEGPLWFYNAHRLELELSPTPSFTVFGGGGRRLFRELGRSRIEVDAGAGGNLRPLDWMRLLAALTGRAQKADKAGYDLLGGTLLASAEFKLPADWSLRAGALASGDHYPHSAGYFDPTLRDERRSDLLIKVSASGYSPFWQGLKAGLTYEFSNRLSTTSLYRYTDHRLLLKLVWNFTLDPWAPATVAPAGHVPLDHGIAAAGFEERLQDLLRQDEAAQRSSSCVE